MSIALIGGTGFIGRHLCEHLKKTGVPAVVLSHRPDVQFLRSCVPSITAVEIDSAAATDVLASSKVVVLLAHRSRPSSSPLGVHNEISANVNPMAELLDRIASLNKHCHIIYASSGGQIYGLGKSVPIREDEIAAPVTAYGMGKLLIENLLSYYARSQGLRVTILRIANPVGYWQTSGSHGLVTAAALAARNQQPLTIFGSGHNYRDYFDVDDLCELLGRFCLQELTKEGVFNIGSGRAYSELDVLEIVSKVIGMDVPRAFSPARPFDLPFAVLDPSLAESRLGWHVSTSLEEAIAKIDQRIRCSSKPN